jgi:hypothetical protein
MPSFAITQPVPKVINRSTIRAPAPIHRLMFAMPAFYRDPPKDVKPLQPELASIKAGLLLLNEIDTLASAGVDFAF